MSNQVEVEGKVYISSKRAAEICGYAQDYVGQLARSGKILATRVGGLWYVDQDSVIRHKEVSDSYIPTPPKREGQKEKLLAPDSSVVNLDGKAYVSASRAAKMTTYHQDYIGQLARTGKILSKQVGKRWYVDIDALKSHKKEKDTLLAAVQAESVGIQTKDIPADETKSARMSADVSLAEEVGLHYTYKSEDKPLFPQVSERVKNENVQATQEEKPAPSLVEDQRNIPIRIVHAADKRVDAKAAGQSSHNLPKSSQNLPSRVPRKAIFSNIFPFFAIIIVSLFIFNLNIFRIPETIKAGDAQHVLSGMNLDTIQHPHRILGGVVHRLTNLFSRELRYVRDE